MITSSSILGTLQKNPVTAQSAVKHN